MTTKKKGLPKFIHQANVRRAVVVRHITDIKNRGHRAYVNVDLCAMEKKAQQLPEDGLSLIHI